MSRTAWIALTAAALVVATGVVVGALLVDGGSTKSNPPVSSSRSFLLPLAENPSALALGKHTGSLLVGIAARTGGPVEVAALRGETPVATDQLQIQIGDRAVEAKSCGRGCSRVEAVVLDGSPARLSVRTGSSSVSFALPARLPPTGNQFFERAKQTMDGLGAYRFTERLSSGRAGVVTDFDVQSPNRLRLRTSGGFRSVIIGRSRWDYRGSRWERGPFPGLNVADVLMWSRAKHPRIVARSGGLTELAAFGLQPVPAWFRLAVDPSGRVLKAEMISPSHFMLHRYSDFNGPIVIRPPT